MSTFNPLVHSISPVAQVADAGVKLGQHAMTQLADVKKHHQENPDPASRSSVSRCTTVGLFNKVETRTEINIKNEKDGAASSFVNGMAWGAGVAVTLGICTIIFKKLTEKDVDQARKVEEKVVGGLYPPESTLYAYMEPNTRFLVIE